MTRSTLILRGLIVLALLALLIQLGAGAYFTTMPGASAPSALPALSAQEEALARRLREHVTTLTTSPIAPRSALNPEGYRGAASWLQAQLVAMGYEVTRRPVTVRGHVADNLIAQLPGTSHPTRIIVLGAHYDAHRETPGADDNASGVAGLLEIARALREQPQPCTVRFELYANEEPPYFQHPDQMGSRVLAADARQRGDDVALMLSLEMIGYYDPAPKTQRYPRALGIFYPDTADFIAFVTRTEHRAQLRQLMRWWRAQRAFPSQGFAGPQSTPGIDYSDHWSYWQEGYPAIMVTDTSFFRNDRYHQATDTADTLDYERFARVVAGLIELTRELAKAP